MPDFAARGLALLRQLLQWWIAELSALVPARLRHRLTPVTDRLVVLLGGHDAVLCLETRQELRTLGRIDLGVDAELHLRLASILRRHGLAQELAHGTVAASLRLPAERALRTAVDLPLAAEANLEEVISFELDRHTPFRSDQAVFAHRILERDPVGLRLAVELTVVPRSIIAEALALAARLHLDVDRIDVAEAGGELAASGNLLPSRSPASKGRRYERKLTYALRLATALLAIIAIYLPLYNMKREEEALAQQVTAAKNAAASAAALQKEIDAVRKDELFLVDRKRDQPTASTLLLETTRILPDDTWLSEWQLAGNEVQITGYAGSASGLVKLLEQSHSFRNTTFQSPVVQDSRTGRERFHISAQLAEGAAQ